MKTRCKNTATHGDYCGHHHKHPCVFESPESEQKPKSEPKSEKPERRVSERNTRRAAATRIQKWFRETNPLHQWRTRGPAYHDRSLCVNDADFFSMDSVADISGFMFFSYMEKDTHIYGFDIRSIATLIANAAKANAAKAEDEDQPPENPFNRDPIPLLEVQKVQKIVEKLKYSKISTEWAKLEPQTPDQQYRMKVVDLFQLIDGLNYYSSPDWFLVLNFSEHMKFYRELHSIWVYRANLTLEQKETIVPNYISNLFHHSPRAISRFSAERMKKVNMGVIKTLITSAADRNDRILGAMYVMSAMTLVNSGARDAYPWLYESVIGNDLEFPEEQENIPPPLFGMTGWLRDLLYMTMPPLVPNQQNTMPFLALPPPAED
jgi:hypothetical protein